MLILNYCRRGLTSVLINYKDSDVNYDKTHRYGYLTLLISI